MSNMLDWALGFAIAVLIIALGCAVSSLSTSACPDKKSDQYPPTCLDYPGPTDDSEDIAPDFMVSINKIHATIDDLFVEREQSHEQAYDIEDFLRDLDQVDPAETVEITTADV